MRATILLAAMAMAACGTAEEPTVDQTAVTEDAAPAKRVVTVTTSSEEARAAYLQGRDFQANIKQADAVKAFEEALSLDPSFALAKAWMGEATPGDEGLTLLREASAMATGLPDAERLSIESLLAFREGEEDRAADLQRKVAELAPDDWQAQAAVGSYAYFSGDYDGAKAALERATELNPKGHSWNMLGYVHAAMGDFDGAAVAMQKYVEAAPGEANPQDSLGEILMMAGRLGEAEQSFVAAAETDPAFWVAWSGAAQARFLQGDKAGGFEALEAARAAAERPQDLGQIQNQFAWSQFAFGDIEAAHATLDEYEAALKETGNETFTWVPFKRAAMLRIAGDTQASLVQIDEGVARAEAAGVEGKKMAKITRHAAADRLMAAAIEGNAAEAEAQLAILVQVGADDDQMHQSKGVVAMAKGDYAAALEAFSHADARDAWGQYLLAKAHKKSGDMEAYEAGLAKVRAINHRDPGYLAVWAKAGGIEAAATPTTAQVDDQD